MRSSSLVPGAMDAGLDSLLFWGSLALALAVAFCAAYPVNRWLIARGKGHAVVHAPPLTERHDVVVVGAGVMGLASAWALRRAGRDVTVLEQFEVGHDRGSSHGASRIFRFAYDETEWVALAQEALPLWRELEQESGTEVLHLTGLLDARDDSAPLRRALEACSAEYELLAPAQVAERFGIELEGEVVLELHGGIVRADRALAAFSRGIPIETGVQVLALRPGEDGVSLETSRGLIHAALAIVAAGAWATPLLADAGIELETSVSQETVSYFDLPAARHPSVGHRLERGNRPSHVLALGRRKRPQGGAAPLGRGGRARRAGRAGSRPSSKPSRSGCGGRIRPPIPRRVAPRPASTRTSPMTRSSSNVMGRSSVARHAPATGSSSRRPSAHAWPRSRDVPILYAMNPREMSLRTKFFVLVALGSILTATAAYVLHFRFLDNLERQTIDLRFSLRGDEAAPPEVVIVKVDDVTFQEMPKYRWPYPRTLHAKLLDRIREGQSGRRRVRHPVQRARDRPRGQRSRVRAPPCPRQDSARDDRGRREGPAEPDLQRGGARATRRPRR